MHTRLHHRRLGCATGLWLALVTIAGSMLAAAPESVPTLINYQGQLQDPKGQPLATGDYVLTFSIFDAASGGKRIWGPQIFDGRTGAGFGLKIPVVQGYFNAMLGPVDATGLNIAAAFDQPQRFVELQVGDGPPISPRQQILASPYAFRAGFAEQAAKAFSADTALVAAKSSKAEVADRATVADSVVNAGNAETAKLAEQSKDSQKLAGADWSAVFGVNDPAKGRVQSDRIADGAISLPKMAPLSIGTNVGIGGIALSRPSGSHDIREATWTPVTNLMVTIITTGRPVEVFLVGDDEPDLKSGSLESIIYPRQVSGNTRSDSEVGIFRNDKERKRYWIGVSLAPSAVGFPPSIIRFLDYPPAGSHTYSIKAFTQPGGGVMFHNVKLVAREW